MANSYPRAPRLLALHIGAALLGASLPALSLEYSGSVQAGLTHSDNSLQTERGERSDVEYGLGAAIEIAHRAGRIDFMGNYGADHTEFDRNTQDTSNELSGDSLLNFALLPELLSWQLRHSRSNERTDTREVDIPDNRDTREIIATGPQLRLPVTDHDFLTASAQYMQVNNDLGTGGDNDSDRKIGSLGWTRLVTPSLDLSLDASRQDVDFDQRGQADLQTERAGLSAVQRYRLGRLEATVGRNRTERDGGERVSGGYYRGYADLSSAGHTFSIAGTQELTDSALGLDAFGFGQGQGDGVIPDDNFDPANPNFDQIDIVERRSVELNYSTVRVCDRCVLSARLVHDESDFDTSPDDERSRGGSVGFDYRWTETFSTGVSYAIERTDYTDDPDHRQDDTDELALEARWQFAPAWSLLGDVAREERDSNQADGDYTEHRVGLAVRYSFDHRTAGSGAR